MYVSKKGKIELFVFAIPCSVASVEVVWLDSQERCLESFTKYWGPSQVSSAFSSWIGFISSAVYVQNQEWQLPTGILDDKGSGQMFGCCGGPPKRADASTIAVKLYQTRIHSYNQHGLNTHTHTSSSSNSFRIMEIFFCELNEEPWCISVECDTQ